MSVTRKQQKIIVFKGVEVTIMLEFLLFQLNYQPIKYLKYSDQYGLFRHMLYIFIDKFNTQCFFV